MGEVTLTQILWWLANLLAALLIVEGIKKKIFTRYLFFFSYLSCELATSLAAYFVYIFIPEAYLTFYWYIRFVSIAAGYCVTWEIYRQVLADYVGTAKIARCLVTAFFLLALSIALVRAFSEDGSGLTKSVIGFERNLRAGQGILLTLLLTLIWYYAIPLGRNLWGLISGYGLFIGLEVITLALRSYLGPSFQIWWQYLQQVSILITLMIWVPAFWSYAPNPKPEVEIRIEEDYVFLAERTLRAIEKARHSLFRVLQP